MAIIEELERGVVTVDTGSLRIRGIDGRITECKDERVI